MTGYSLKPLILLLKDWYSHFTGELLRQACFYRTLDFFNLNLIRTHALEFLLFLFNLEI